MRIPIPKSTAEYPNCHLDYDHFTAVVLGIILTLIIHKVLQKQEPKYYHLPVVSMGHDPSFSILHRIIIPSKNNLSV